MDTLSGWARELGYDQLEGAFIRAGDRAVDDHPFAPELRSIFGAAQGSRADAVFCVDRVPTVYLLAQKSLSAETHTRRSEIRSLCEKLWNQNLARIVLITDDDSIEAWSVDNADAAPERFERSQAQISAWSVSGLLGGEALRGREAWFDPKKRVDKTLLDNIQDLVARLIEEGLEPARARQLVARIIFVTYLEDREIIGALYRETRKVRALYELVKKADAKGLQALFACLRKDFNGDFLSSADGESEWLGLSKGAFYWLHQFLSQTTLRTGQTAFWRYDFSQIPIELIASIYETFLASKDAGKAPLGTAKKRQGAYYTPRLLADWVVDLALEGRDVLQERIFDAACGSGMLLTAAFRRLIRSAEIAQARRGEVPEVPFEARCSLLLGQIFGGDIDEDACQLTGFSLYLALLSDLNPRDLAVLRKGGHKLPSLTKNIRRGVIEGDFFSRSSEHANKGRFTVFLSNPPWRELTQGEAAATAVEDWRKRQPKPYPTIPKQQVAAAFALGAADCLQVGARLALILPVNLFLSAERTQRAFRADLLGRFKILKVVNFSDMRRLIFADAVHPFVVLIAEARDAEARFDSIEAETFSYWTPKTDISLALGRIAVHGGDRADLATAALLDEVPQLRLRYWGSESDVALLRRLSRHGRVRDLTASHGWIHAKGFHAQDNDVRRSPEKRSIPAPEWMKSRPFLHANRLPSDSFMVGTECFEKFPYADIAREPPRRLFEGPRVIWPDGTHPETGVKAIFADAAFTFQHSLAVLSAPDTDDGRRTAKFLTAYLRSPLGIWLLLLLSGSVAAERPKLHVQEALDWPFWSLAEHPQPDRAASILLEVDGLVYAHPDWSLTAEAKAVEMQARLNKLVYEYFCLEPDEIGQIEELAFYAGSAIQPTSLRHRALAKPIRLAPSEGIIAEYCSQLRKAMSRWQRFTGGSGSLDVTAWTGRNVPLGAAVLTLNGVESERPHDDLVITEIANSFSKYSQSPAETLLTVPDIALVEGNRILIVKPLVTRFWLQRCAIEDASRLALQLQSISAERMSS